MNQSDAHEHSRSVPYIRMTPREVGLVNTASGTAVIGLWLMSRKWRGGLTANSAASSVPMFVFCQDMGCLGFTKCRKMKKDAKGV